MNHLLVSWSRLPERKFFESLGGTCKSWQLGCGLCHSGSQQWCFAKVLQLELPTSEPTSREDEEIPEDAQKMFGWGQQVNFLEWDSAFIFIMVLFSASELWNINSIFHMTRKLKPSQSHHHHHHRQQQQQQQQQQQFFFRNWNNQDTIGNYMQPSEKGESESSFLWFNAMFEALTPLHKTVHWHCIRSSFVPRFQIWNHYEGQLAPRLKFDIQLAAKVLTSTNLDRIWGMCLRPTQHVVLWIRTNC